VSKQRGDGQGSTYQERDGQWRAQIRYVDQFRGKSIIVRRRAKSRDDARAKLKELQAETRTAAPVRANTTVAEYLNKWAADTLPLSGVSAATIRVTGTLIVNPIAPTLGRVRLSDFTTATAEQWLARLHKAHTVPKGPQGATRPLAAGTLHKSFHVLKTCLSTAVRDGLLETNPLDKLSAPRTGKTTVPATTAEDFDTIVEAVRGLRMEPLIIVVGLTGCRIGEALGLQWADVDLSRAEVTFRRSGATTAATKTGKIRTVPIVAEAVAALKLRRKTQREDRLAMGSGWQDRRGFVFTTFEGRPVGPQNARRDFRRELARNGLETARPFHSLRHGLATRLLQREVPMHVVSAILGHSSIKMTVDTYGHVEPAMHAEALAAALAKK
jgi:integrase